MTENGKSQVQTIISAMLGFVLVVGVGALALMSRGGSAKAPSQASRPSSIPAAPAAEPARPAEAASSAAPAASVAASAATSASGLTSVIKEPASAPAPAAPKPAALVVTQHLDATQTTSAQASVAAAPAEKKPEPRAKKEFVAPKLVTPKNGGIASTVHYGVSSRSELMGRAAGPVYNFKGRDAKKTGSSDSRIGGDASTQIEEAQRQLESSSLDEKSKKDLREKFQLVNDGIGKTGSN